MTGTTSLRKSNRLTKGADGASGQSRITEFVNVRKRAAGVEPSKKIEEVEVYEKKENSVVLTPVKNKRKFSKGADSNIVEELKKSGVLTPSPSLESVTEKKEKVVTEQPDDIEDMTEILDTKQKQQVIESKSPAYERFAHLVEGVRNQKPKLDIAIEAATKTANITSQYLKPLSSSLSGHKFVPWLPLNDKWAIYEKLIFNVDNLCVLAAGRSQPCVFHKIQKTLENVLSRKVPLEQMEQLKTLWPEAYEYRGSRVVIQGKRIESVAFGIPGIGGTDSSAALLNDRKEQVRGRVQKYLINAHRETFFDTNISADIPKEWHSKFDQNAVAELPRMSLIEPETGVREGYSTPKLISEIISSQSSSAVIDTTDDTINVNTSNIHTTSNSHIIPSAAVKLSLLERIREKEQKLQARKCFGEDPETARLEAILSQMERFTQSVMFTFSSAKKTSMFLTDLTSKLVQSSVTPLSSVEILERLKLLEKAAPNWIKIVDDCVGENLTPKHVKILDKTRSLNSILESLKEMKRK